jgi:hypothetical protein
MDHRSADGNGVFAKALCLDLTFRPAAWACARMRYSMLVLDGVVKELNIEPEPGKADLSSAEQASFWGKSSRQNAGAARRRGGRRDCLTA